MNDTTNYSFSFSYDVPASPPAKLGGPELIMFDDCHVFELADDQVLVRSKRTGKQTLLTQDVLYSVRQCDAFKTLEQHISHLASSIPELAGQTADIRHILTSVQASGLMVSARELAASLTQGSAISESQTPICLCILTCGRPDALARLLQSMGQQHEFRPHDRYYVIDDSRELKLQTSNSEVVASFNQQFETNVVYFGLPEQAKLLQELQSSLPEHQAAINFLIGRYTNEQTPSYGRTRNLALLLSVGRPLIMLDDDIVYQKHQSPDMEPGARISPLPRDVIFYSENHEWAKYAAPTEPTNLTDEFAQLLGCSLEQALATLELESLPQHRLAEIMPHDLPMINKDTKILAAGCGTYGDPGMASNGWIYEINAKARDRLLSSEDFYQEACTKRNLWSGRHTTHFSPRFVLLSQMTGVDNRELLPPYFPLFRNEDFLFGVSLQFLHPNSLMVDFPWALPHLSMEERHWDKASINRPMRYGMLDFTSDYLAPKQASYQSNEPGLRLQALSCYFSDLAAMDDASLAELIKNETNAFQCARIQRLSNGLTEFPQAPDYWAADIHTAIAANQRGLMEAPDAFAYCLKDVAEDQRMGQARELWQQFGHSLAAWEDIRLAAQKLTMKDKQ